MSAHKKPGIVRRSAAFVRREASYIMGWEHVKLGRRALSTQWHRASKRVCPACGIGRMFKFSETIHGESKEFFGCNSCAHFQSVNVDSDPESLRRLRDVAMAKMQSMNADEYLQLQRKYQMSSRWLFAFSTGVLLFALYLLVVGGSAWTFLNTTAVSLFLFVQGLVASYRHWQLREKVLFVRGAFGKWLRSGQWLV